MSESLLEGACGHESDRQTELRQMGFGAVVIGTALSDGRQSKPVIEKLIGIRFLALLFV